MDQNNTYFPEDIEQLLVTKTYEELLPEEEKFVLQHVDSKDEYKLMRNTLLAIKNEISNHESLKPDPQIKTDLLSLMEEKKRRTGWFNLNSFWGFLFPEEANFFQKPGFQFASVAILVGLSFFFAKNFLIEKSENDLAINTKESNEHSINGQPELKSQDQSIIAKADSINAHNDMGITDEELSNLLVNRELDDEKKEEKEKTIEWVADEDFFSLADSSPKFSILDGDIPENSVNGLTVEKGDKIVIDNRNAGTFSESPSFDGGYYQKKQYYRSDESEDATLTQKEVRTDMKITEGLANNTVAVSEKVNKQVVTGGTVEWNDGLSEEVQKEGQFGSTIETIKLKGKDDKSKVSRSLKDDSNLISLLHITL